MIPHIHRVIELIHRVLDEERSIFFPRNADAIRVQQGSQVRAREVWEQCTEPHFIFQIAAVIEQLSQCFSYVAPAGRSFGFVEDVRREINDIREERFPTSWWVDSESTDFSSLSEQVIRESFGQAELTPFCNSFRHSRTSEGETVAGFQRDGFNCCEILIKIVSGLTMTDLRNGTNREQIEDVSLPELFAGVRLILNYMRFFWIQLELADVFMNLGTAVLDGANRNKQMKFTPAGRTLVYGAITASQFLVIVRTRACVSEEGSIRGPSIQPVSVVCSRNRIREDKDELRIRRSNDSRVSATAIQGLEIFTSTAGADRSNPFSFIHGHRVSVSSDNKELQVEL